MYRQIIRNLLQQALITPADAGKITQFETRKPFSLHWELKTMLYLGVLLLNVGLGVLVYENIDSIGHVVIITAIGLVSVGCFWYAIRHRYPFSLGEVKSPTPYYDYILLLGCLTLLLMEGYWQYQYQIFGTRYGLATFIPMVLFFAIAYWLDNRGVLSLAITALASWMGITVSLQEILTKNDFSSQAIAHTGIFLGALLTVIPFALERINIKKHFSLTYLNFGVHIGMISCLAGLFLLDIKIVYFALLCLFTGFFMWYARTRHSVYFLTVVIVYSYIGITYAIFTALPDFNPWFYLFYFLISCIGIIVFLTNYKKFFKNYTP